MGMRLSYVSVPPSAADALRKDPNLAPSLLEGPMLGAVSAGNMQQIQQLMRQAGLDWMSPHIQSLIGGGGGSGSGGSGPSILRQDAVRGELEKAWHGLHFVFTGVADEAKAPLGYLLSGGEEVGEDMGYGSARLLKLSEVQAFRDALVKISDAEFDRRFDLNALRQNQIYPDCWDEDRDELLDEYQMYFDQLKSDLDATIQAGEMLLIAID